MGFLDWLFGRRGFLSEEEVALKRQMEGTVPSWQVERAGGDSTAVSTTTASRSTGACSSTRRFTYACVSCHPDVTDESCACKWRFTLHDED